MAPKQHLEEPLTCRIIGCSESGKINDRSRERCGSIKTDSCWETQYLWEIWMKLFWNLSSFLLPNDITRCAENNLSSVFLQITIGSMCAKISVLVFYRDTYLLAWCDGMMSYDTKSLVVIFCKNEVLNDILMTPR